MKTIDLNDEQTRLDVIEAIVKRSSHFTCGNVEYVRTKLRVRITEVKGKDVFHSTGILNELGAFMTWFSYEPTTGKIELVVG